MLQPGPNRWREPLLPAGPEIGRWLVLVAAFAIVVALIAATAGLTSAAAWRFDGLGAPDLARPLV